MQQRCTLPGALVLSPHSATKCCTRHGLLGSGRISHAQNPISSGVKLGSTRLTLSRSKLKSDLLLLEWSQCRPASYFEMRPSRPRGLKVAHRAMIAIGGISGDPAPSDPSDQCLPVSLPLRLSLPASIMHSSPLRLNKI